MRANTPLATRPHPRSRRVAKGLLFASMLAAFGASAETIVGLTNTNQLAIFDSAAPANASALVTLSGLQTNEILLGIDYRPADGRLYGLGSANRLYTVQAATGVSTFLAALTTADGTAPFSLAGGAYGVDFNPVPDLGLTLPSLRVTSTSGENLRINVNPGVAGRVSGDTALSGPQGTPRIAASAYTNPDTDPATGTALFGIDFATDSLYQQAPPNNGTLTLIGALGVDTSGLVGFDIAQSGASYASLTSPLTGKSAVYALGSDGSAALIGAFGIGGNTAIAPSLTDIAIAPVPEPAEYALFLAGLGVVAWGARRQRRDAQARSRAH
jgi:hypothetical protein